MYLVLAIVAGLVAFSLFRDVPYTIGQVAFVLAIPIVLFYFLWRLVNRPSSEAKRKQRKEEPATELSNWVGIPSVLFLLSIILSLFTALTMSISSGVYLLAKLEWAAAF